MTMRPPLVCVLLTALSAAALAAGHSDQAPDFSGEVRPILAENCFKCHGMDRAKHDLRLDGREAALLGGESGLPAIVPGEPDESEVYRRIISDDSDDRMPPLDSHKTLTAAQIDILRRWIGSGAEYRTHWAFVPPVRPAPPAARPARWARNPIDRFILEKLSREGLAPARPADAITVCRRLYLDLVGLPPTPQETDRFAAAYARAPDAAVGALTKELLASPHYGEKWARPWLDAARYADTNGYEKDQGRIVWPYRDYVIDALNRDLPYDRFIVEQLAGDLLPNPTPEQIAATGFLRLSMLNEEGAIDPEEFRMAAMFDRVDVLGKAVLGLTVACAQCHNHKFDPITQEDYYRLFAFLNNDYEARPTYYLPEQRREVRTLQKEMTKLLDAMRAEIPSWSEKEAQWENERRAAEPSWETLALENVGNNAQRYELQSDGSYLAKGYAATQFTGMFKSRPTLRRITAVRIELLTHPDLPANGPGRGDLGEFELSELEVKTEPDRTVTPEQAMGKVVDHTGMIRTPSLKFSAVTGDLDATFWYESSEQMGPSPLAADGDEKTAWSNELPSVLRNADRAAVFALAEPLVLAPGAPFYVDLVQMHPGIDVNSRNLGRFRVRVTDAVPPQIVLANDVLAALAVPREKRSPAENEKIFRAWCETVPELKDDRKKVAALWKRWPAYTTTYALQRRDEPRVTHILARGDWLKPTRAVTPATPAFLPGPPPGSDGSRLTLARWITDPKSPLTARVFVNRLWQSYFGVGLVSSPEDFGLQSLPPSNPALLDWLACEFMHPSEPGVAPWSVKHMQWLIATSATYRQSSHVTPELFARDPENRLLARGPRFRVESEIIRDIALASSGLLNPRIGGRSVMPPAPADLFLPPASYTTFPWKVEDGEQKYRRAIYTLRRRTTMYPMLQAFDTPSGETACVRRFRSNTPLQALTLLNEPVFMDCAVALARRTLEQAGPTDRDRVTDAFRRVVSRAPDSDERVALLALLERQRRRYAQGELDPAAMFAPDEPPPLGSSSADWASLTVVARAILNLDETITKE